MIIFDMDGTLSIVGDRVKYLTQNPKDWNSFYEACDEDLPKTQIIKVLKALEKNGYGIKIVTGRRESTREKTLVWLKECGINIHTNDLHMRKDNDYRHDTTIKPELVKDFINAIEMVFEDRNSMVKKWRELGITCLQVADGDF